MNYNKMTRDIILDEMLYPFSYLDRRIKEALKHGVRLTKEDGLDDETLKLIYLFENYNSYLNTKILADIFSCQPAEITWSGKLTTTIDKHNVELYGDEEVLEIETDGSKALQDYSLNSNQVFWALSKIDELKCKNRYIYDENDLDNYQVSPQKIPIFNGCTLRTNAKDISSFLFPDIALGISIGKAINAENVDFPKIVLDDFSIYNVRNAKGSRMPKIVFNNFLADNIESAEDITWPEFVDGYFSVGYLKSAKGLKVPKYIINGDLILGMITDEFLDLSENSVGGNVYLSELIHAHHLPLPKKAKAVFMENLESPKGLIIPNPLTYEIIGKNFNINPSNVDSYRKVLVKK